MVKLKYTHQTQIEFCENVLRVVFIFLSPGSLKHTGEEQNII